MHSRLGVRGTPPNLKKRQLPKLFKLKVLKTNLRSAKRVAVKNLRKLQANSFKPMTGRVNLSFSHPRKPATLASERKTPFSTRSVRNNGPVRRSLSEYAKPKTSRYPKVPTVSKPPRHPPYIKTLKKKKAISI